tara:strand:+ start:1449 stop:2045 length:597 start_codon:yes stop_codon:yes gene_type:complete
MEKYFGNFKNLIILVLIIVIIFLRQCSGDGGEITPSEPTIITKVETKYDTITKEVTKYVPKIITKIKTEIDTIRLTQKIDTVAILEDYFAKYVYEDFQQLDSLNLTIRDTISQNKILSRKIFYDLIYPTTTVTETKYINQREFYVGFGLNGTSTQFNYIGGSILYRTRKKQMFGIGLGLNDQFQPIISTQFLWKLGKK